MTDPRLKPLSWRGEALRRKIRIIAAEAPNLSRFIDDLLGKGISIRPRMAGSAGLLSIRFERDGVSLTRSEAGLRLEGPLMYSVTRHDPIMARIERDLKRGLPQRPILDEAWEVALPIEDPPARQPFSLQLIGAIQRIVESREDLPDELLLRPDAGYDHWSGSEETGLRKHLAADVRPEIEAMPAPHRLAALRWACRFCDVERMGYGIPDPQELAILRQEAVMRYAALRRPDPPENGRDNGPEP